MTNQELVRIRARENLSKIKVHYEMKRLQKEQVEREENLLLSTFFEVDKEVMQSYLCDVPWYCIEEFYEEFSKQPKTKAEKAKRTKTLKTHRESIVKSIFPYCMKDIAITAVTALGYERYGFDLEFELNGDKWQLSIPMPRNMTIKNYNPAKHGDLGFILYKKEGLCWTWQMKDKDINEVKKFLVKKFFSYRMCGRGKKDEVSFTQYSSKMV